MEWQNSISKMLIEMGSWLGRKQCTPRNWPWDMNLMHLYPHQSSLIHSELYYFRIRLNLRPCRFCHLSFRCSQSHLASDVWAEIWAETFAGWRGWGVGKVLSSSPIYTQRSPFIYSSAYWFAERLYVRDLISAKKTQGVKTQEGDGDHQTRVEAVPAPESLPKKLIFTRHRD